MLGFYADTFFFSSRAILTNQELAKQTIKWCTKNMIFRLVTISVLLFFGVINALPASDTPSPAQYVSSVLRTTIIVRDIQSAIDLFKDILGLQVRMDLLLEGDEVNAVLGTEGKKARIVILQSNGDTVGNIALLTYIDEIQAPEEPHNLELEVGEVALVMNTNRIDSIHETLKERGYLVVSPPRVLFREPGMVEQTREMIFIGPEGIAINLVQRGIKAAEDAN